MGDVNPFSVTVTRDDLTPDIKRLVALGHDLTPVMRAMGTTFKSITEGNFNSVGAGYRPKPWPSKYDGSPSNLQRSTTLSKAFHLTVSATEARLGNPMRYARIHQLGGIIKAKNGKALVFNTPDGKKVFVKKVVIPARPFYPILNGQLTPMAESKIVAAARRVITKQNIS